jgi:NADH:ubiquinone reductase (H+-translocating)
MSLTVHEQVRAAHVVVVGGGFAGLKCAMELAAHRDIRITLIDKNNYQQFQPLLYQVAASMLSPGNAAFALRDIFRDNENVDVQMDEVVDIDLERRIVRTGSGKTHAGDYLVLATGSRVNFYGISGAEQYSFPLYSLRDSEKLRSVILQTFEAADRDPESAVRGSVNFVVIGGGPTGVEMAGTLGDMVKRMLPKEFRHVPDGRAQVFLIEASPSVLGTFSSESQSYAASALEEHGVQVRLGVAVKEVRPEAVVLSDGSCIGTKTVIWAAGVKATTMPTQPELSKVRSGRIQVENDLSVHGFARVYAVGDVANAAGENGKPLPQLAAVAQQAGKQCAENIIASIWGKPSKPFIYSDRGILAMIGRNAAVAELGKTHHEIVGPLAFVTWLGVHLALLTVARAKLEAIVEWAWDYFGGEHAGQLIDR